jgi:hypothetical protein
MRTKTATKRLIELSTISDGSTCSILAPALVLSFSSSKAGKSHEVGKQDTRSQYHRLQVGRVEKQAVTGCFAVQISKVAITAGVDSGEPSFL